MSETETSNLSNLASALNNTIATNNDHSVVQSALSTGSQTQVIETSEVNSNNSDPPTLKLRLKKENESDKGEKEKTKPKKLDRKQVSWTQETVDNEHLGKKKSKCCCVYVKPKKFGESDTESEDETDCHDKNCSGHTNSDPKKSGH